jgi:ABC-type Na+ efflux pump permease subunit
MKNLGTMDRLLRVILAEICILVAFFWVAEEWQIPLYLIAGVMLLQAVTATCSIFTILGWNRCEIVQRRDKNLMTAFIVVALLLAVVGSYASIVLTKSIFLEDLGVVNESYNQALHSMDRGESEKAAADYGNLESAFGAFSKKYSKYRPLTVKFDGNFTLEMNNISAAISGSKEDILQGNLTRGSEELKKAQLDIKKMQDR